MDDRWRQAEDRGGKTGDGGGKTEDPPLGVRPPFAVLPFSKMIVVLAIIAVTTAVVVPRVGSNWKQFEDSDFLQQFTESIQRSRLFAMNCGRPIAFRLNGAERIFGSDNPPRQPIPLNAEIFSDNLEMEPETGDFLIIFHPDGSLVGNDLEVVFDHERTYHIYIHPLFGTVSLERIK